MHDKEYVVKAIKPSTPNQDDTKYMLWKPIIKERPTVTIKKYKRWNYDKLQLGEIKWNKRENNVKWRKKTQR